MVPIGTCRGLATNKAALKRLYLVSRLPQNSGSYLNWLSILVKNFAIVICVVGAIVGGFLIYLASWDPPPPTQHIEKQLPDDVFKE